MTEAIEFPSYVCDVILEATSVRLVQLRKSTLRLSAVSPIVIVVARNEILIMEQFYKHYRSLGVKRFVVIDNNSSDGTLEHALDQPDADVYRADRKFDWRLKQGWICRIVANYGLDRWYACLDADEHLIFDDCQHRTLGDLAAYADRVGLTRVRGMLLDMYTRGPLSDFHYRSGEPLLKAFPLFDSDSYIERRFTALWSRKGGPRARVFFESTDRYIPEMTKYPLFKPTAGDMMVNPHHHFPFGPNFASPCLIGILHFKFLQTLTEKISSAISEGNYWNDSYEYRKYNATLEKNPASTFEYEGSREYRAASDLIDAGLIDPVWSSPRVQQTRVAVRREA